MTHSSAGTGTSCRCAQATSRHHSRSYEQTYSHQFEHRQMIDLMQNVGEFEGTAIANELTHTCALAHMPPMDCCHSRIWLAIIARLNTQGYRKGYTTIFSSAKTTIYLCFIRSSEPWRQLCACLRPQKSDLTPPPPRPRIRGTSPKYFPLFRPKEFSYER